MTSNKGANTTHLLAMSQMHAEENLQSRKYSLVDSEEIQQQSEQLARLKIDFHELQLRMLSEQLKVCHIRCNILICSLHERLKSLGKRFPRQFGTLPDAFHPKGLVSGHFFDLLPALQILLAGVLNKRLVS